MLEIDALFFAVLAVMILTDYTGRFLITFFSIMLHEFGHAFWALCAGKRIHTVRIMPVGLCLEVEQGSLSKPERVLLHICGPLVNLALCIAGLAWSRLVRGFDPGFFILVNLYLAFFNLIPVLPLDGGKVLRDILSVRMGLFLANSLIIKASYFLALALAVLGTVQFIHSHNNFSLFILGIYIFFSLKSEKMEAALMNIKSIIYRRSRLAKKGLYCARDLVALKSMHMGDILKNMDFDRFHLIHILDENLKIITVITEQELLDALLEYNTDITFGEFLQKQGR